MNTKLLSFLLIMAAAPLPTLAQTAPALQPRAEAAPLLPAAATPNKPDSMATSAAEAGPVEEAMAFDQLALPDAIRELAKLAGLNIQIDPALLNQKATDGTPIPPPSLTEQWRRVTPMQAMQALLFNYGWQMERVANNPIVLIRARDPNAAAPLATTVNLLDAAQGGPVEETMAFDQLPLPDAIRNLAALAGMNIQLDPRLANRQDGNHQPIPFPTVNEKMKNVTARQAMQTLLDEFGWQATRITGNPILRIEALDPKAPNALAKPAQAR